MDFKGDSADFNRRFWSAYAEHLAGAVKTGSPSDFGGPTSTWLVPAAKGMLAQFTDLGLDDDDDATPTGSPSEIQRFNGALYDYANRLPQWSVSWTGASDGDFFKTYADLVRQLRPKDADPAKQAAVDKARDDVIAFENEVSKIQANFNKDYKDNNMTDGKWNDGYSPSTMRTDFKNYMTSDEYQNKYQTLIEAGNIDQMELGRKLMQAQEDCYGASFVELSEALKQVQLADPLVTTGDKREPAQMQIADGSGQWVPAYKVQGADNLTGLDNYKKWLTATQAAFTAGTPPTYTFVMQQNEIDSSNSEVKTESSAALPFADIFVGSAGESTDTKSSSIEKEDFNVQISIQDVFLLSVEPDSAWYDESILKFATKDYLPADSIYVTQPLGGPTGSFNLQIVGIVIGVGRSVTFSSSHFKDDEWSQQIDVHASCSLFGIFSMGGASYHSYAATSLKITEGESFTIADTTNAPTVIGVLVKQVFPTPS